MKTQTKRLRRLAARRERVRRAEAAPRWRAPQHDNYEIGVEIKFNLGFYHTEEWPAVLLPLRDDIMQRLRRNVHSRLGDDYEGRDVMDNLPVISGPYQLMHLTKQVACDMYCDHLREKYPNLCGVSRSSGVIGKRIEKLRREFHPCVQFMAGVPNTSPPQRK